jgi:hypothetical protein
MIMIAIAGLLLCCCMISLSAGGGYYYINYVADDTSSPPPDSPPDDEEEESGPSYGVSGLSGMKFIKKGGQSLAVKTSKCNSSSVGMQDTKENSRHVWNIAQVPGRSDYYYISSKNRQDKACEKRYLTSNSSCNKGLYLANSGLADRQYFTFDSSGDGYVIKNVNCDNKGFPAYLSASSQNKGQIKLQSRPDMVFSLKDQS